MPVDRETALERLRKKEARLMGELGIQQHEFLSEIKLPAESRHRTDPADMAGPAYAGLSPRHSLMSQQGRALDKVRRVISGLEHDTLSHPYGFCTSCEDEIPEGRLEEFPEATLCVGCKTAEEQQKKKSLQFQKGIAGRAF